LSAVLQRLKQAWQARQEQAALARRPIPDLLWRRTLKRFPFLVQGPGRDEAQLRRMTSLFLDRKEFTGAHGLSITDDMAVAIAAQACLPVLHLGLGWYDSFVGIVVQPGQVRVRREHVDEDGIVHEADEVLLGEAVPGGPVMLSWRDVRASGATASDSVNVVIHEFAHLLDMADGEMNGRPPLPPGLSVATWDAVMQAEYEAFCERVDAEEPTVIDPYGAEAIEEFFGVASEAFFVNREGLQREHPQLDTLLARAYRYPVPQKD
jgi:MtfA peptidase